VLGVRCYVVEFVDLHIYVISGLLMLIYVVMHVMSCFWIKSYPRMTKYSTSESVVPAIYKAKTRTKNGKSYYTMYGYLV
jgi:hypothetical protein